MNKSLKKHIKQGRKVNYRQTKWHKKRMAIVTLATAAAVAATVGEVRSIKSCSKLGISSKQIAIAERILACQAAITKTSRAIYGIA